MTDRDGTLIVCLPVLPEHKDRALDSGGKGNRVKWKEGRGKSSASTRGKEKWLVRSDYGIWDNSDEQQLHCLVPLELAARM